jgi:hypothetical protein
MNYVEEMFEYNSSIAIEMIHYLATNVVLAKPALIGMYLAFMSVCYAIGVSWLVFEQINDPSKKIPYFAILLKLGISIGLMICIQGFIVAIIAITNYIADAFLNITDIKEVAKLMWGKSYEDGLEIKLFNFNLVSFLSVGCGLAAQICFVTVGFWRVTLLCMHFLNAPIILSLSMLPGYDNLTKDMVKDIIQIALWVIPMSFLTIIVGAFGAVQFSISEHGYGLGAIPYIVFMIGFLIGTVRVPSLSAKWFGGNDHSFLTTATAGLAMLAMKNLNKATGDPAGKAGEALKGSGSDLLGKGKDVLGGMKAKGSDFFKKG